MREKCVSVSLSYNELTILHRAVTGYQEEGSLDEDKGGAGDALQKKLLDAMKSIPPQEQRDK